MFRLHTMTKWKKILWNTNKNITWTKVFTAFGTPVIWRTLQAPSGWMGCVSAQPFSDPEMFNQVQVWALCTDRSRNHSFGPVGWTFTAVRGPLLHSSFPWPWLVSWFLMSRNIPAAIIRVLVTSMTEALLPWSLRLARRPPLGRVLVVPFLDAAQWDL